MSIEAAALDVILALAYGVFVALLRHFARGRAKPVVEMGSVFTWFTLFGGGSFGRAALTLFAAATAVWITDRLIVLTMWPPPLLEDTARRPGPGARAAGASLQVLAVCAGLVGSCLLVQNGVAVDRPSTSLDVLSSAGLMLCVLAVVAGYHGFRAGGPARTIAVVAPTALVFGSCAAFYLGYTGQPPFQTSDATGRQYALHRGVPGEVRYTTGYTVAVSAPAIVPPAVGAAPVWVIPVRFSNDERADSAHVGRCSLYVDGRYRDAYRERPSVRALGDVDRPLATYPAGGGVDLRSAFEVAERARDVVMGCAANAYVTAYFDLRPYVGPR